MNEVKNMNETNAARKSRQQLLTEGRPYRKIIGFTLPILIGSLFQQLYNMADSLIVSRALGVQAFAGVSSTGRYPGLCPELHPDYIRRHDRLHVL